MTKTRMMTETRGGRPVISSDEAMRDLAAPWDYAIATGPHGVAIIDLATEDPDAFYAAYLSEEAEAEWLIEGWMKVPETYDRSKPPPVHATYLALNEAARRYPGMVE